LNIKKRSKGIFRISIISIACAVVAAISSKATIINIPADYPAIQQGIDAGAHGDTVLVQPGVYNENVNYNGHNIILGSLFLMTGDTSYISMTIIDGDSSGSVVIFENSETNSAVLTGFTIRNGYASFGGGIYCSGSDPTISHNIVSGNSAYDIQGGEGGGVFCYYSNLILTDNIITANYATGPLGGNGGGIYCGYFAPTISRNIIAGNLGDWGGGGIYCYDANPLIIQNVIAGNTGTVWGGGFYLDESNPMIINNTIWGNVARWNEGGGIYCENNSNPIITNTILWADSALQGGDEIYVEDGLPILTYCDIQGGWQGMGNIDVYPLLRDPFNGDFHLMSTACGDQYDSPCIDVGDPLIIDSLLDCSAGLETALSDLGAFGGGDSTTTGISENTDLIPSEFMLLQNYPNPFNAITKIKFILPKSQEVKLTVYDLLGREFKILLDEYKPAGIYNIHFDASKLASGIYLYRIETASHSQTRKMELVK
jgi:hypothetical protein